jgi:RNA polymerase subunit RPABC4/transcription elongation factor Spt4
VIKDVTNRTTSLILQVVAILLVLIFTPIFGLPVYLLIRPRSTIFEQYYENAELESLESEEQTHNCFSCNAVIEKDFHYCPYCRTELRTECIECKHLIQKNWKLCPYCGVEQAKEEKPKKVVTKKKVIDLTLEAQEEIQEEMKKEETTQEA